MTILLTQAIQVAGVTQPAGTTLTLEAGLEADLVTRKCATFVSRPDQGITAEVFARTDPLTGDCIIQRCCFQLWISGGFPVWRYVRCN